MKQTHSPQQELNNLSIDPHPQKLLHVKNQFKKFATSKEDSCEEYNLSKTHQLLLRTFHKKEGVLQTAPAQKKNLDVFYVIIFS